MDRRKYDTIFGGLGIAAVALMFAAVAIGAAGGGGRTVTISSSARDVADAVASPAGVSTWVGAYVELLSFGCFLPFAMWASGKLGEGALAQTVRAAATSYTAVSVAALGVMDAIAYRAGKGMTVQLATTMFTIEQALYVCTWFLAVFFLIAAAALALRTGRRALGWSAVAIASLILLGTAVSLDDLGQLAFTTWLLWVVYASIALARPRRAAALAASPQRA